MSKRKNQDGMAVVRKELFSLWLNLTLITFRLRLSAVNTIFRCMVEIAITSLIKGRYSLPRNRFTTNNATVVAYMNGSMIAWPKRRRAPVKEALNVFVDEAGNRYAKLDDVIGRMRVG